MFGIVRPCRHSLDQGLLESWIAHLCGLCLTLRDEYGQTARLATSYDGLLISVLVEAQRADRSPHRKARPCALRGLRTAQVVSARAAGARLAAAVSLLLAAGKTRDHIADGDGPFARRAVAAPAARVAARWDAAGGRLAADLAFPADVLREAVARQPVLEAAPGLSLLELTEPTETAVSAAFAHTAVLADRPENAAPLAEAGRFFGRLAHLLDAVEDLAEDRAAGAFNPILATGTTPAEARRQAELARQGLRLALADLTVDSRTLLDALLGREVRAAVERTFAPWGAQKAHKAGCIHHPHHPANSATYGTSKTPDLTHGWLTPEQATTHLPVADISLDGELGARWHAQAGGPHGPNPPNGGPYGQNPQGGPYGPGPQGGGPYGQGSQGGGPYGQNPQGRSFGRGPYGQNPQGGGHQGQGPQDGQGAQGGGWGPPPGGYYDGPGMPPGGPTPMGSWGPGPQRPGFGALCLAWSAVACSCGIWQPPWSGRADAGCGSRCWCTRHCEAVCDGCEGPCECLGACCECVSCCDCS